MVQTDPADSRHENVATILKRELANGGEIVVGLDALDSVTLCERWSWRLRERCRVFGEYGGSYWWWDGRGCVVGEVRGPEGGS